MAVTNFKISSFCIRQNNLILALDLKTNHFETK